MIGMQCIGYTGLKNRNIKFCVVIYSRAHVYMHAHINNMTLFFQISYIELMENVAFGPLKCMTKK